MFLSILEIFAAVITIYVGSIAIYNFRQEDKNAPYVLIIISLLLICSISGYICSSFAYHSYQEHFQNKSALDFIYVDLKQSKSWNGDNLGMIKGIYTFDESPIAFDIGNYIITSGCKDAQTNNIRIEDVNENVEAIYFLIQGGNVYNSFRGQTFGEIQLIFDNASPLTKPLIVGINFRDWAVSNSEVVTTVSDNDITEVRPGKNEVGIEGRLDIIRLEIPRSHRNSTLREIRIDDFLPDMPCLYLHAITVEKS
jgi:hypothetical protein